jgi:hypothetical protein
MRKARFWILLFIPICLLFLISSCVGSQIDMEESESKEPETAGETEKQTVVASESVTEKKETTTEQRETTTVKVTETTAAKTETTTLVTTTAKPDFSKMTELEKYRYERELLKNDPDRKFLYDNDGCEIVYYTNEVSVDGVLAPRFYPLKDTAVDAVLYTPWSSGFGMFTHNTKIGQLFDCTESNFSNNKARQLIEAGIDFLTEMVRFCHENDMEFFFSMRMNDTHDNQGDWYGDIMFEYNKLKTSRPDLLVGTKENPPKYGTWTSVDYTKQEIRDMAYAIFEEACQNYDIDGIHLDFFRHPCFFKDAAEGKVLPQETLDLMTDMVRKIREMTEIEGMKRGRPILVSIRVPDSVEFCRAIGLDIEKWMEEDLVDILCTSSYTQLNYWEYSVELGHKYGVRVYPSVDETRVRDDNANATRMSLESYAARLTNVWNSGADGFLLFNYYSYNSPIFKVGDDTEKLLNYNKHYFASYRGVGYFSRTWPHREFINIPTVNPYDKMELKKGQPVTVVFPIGEDLEMAIEKGKTPSVNLRISLSQAKQKDKIVVELNGKVMEKPLNVPSILSYRLEPNNIVKGMNTLKLMILPEGDDLVYITDIVVDIYY